ncbi:uncharacterized protein Gv1 [Zophobas morio]|uniref:uncharacterized protein Gv1 n=1 Tax=Zophobas morio TaxID=2755281 RepID=UPI003083AA88
MAVMTSASQTIFLLGLMTLATAKPIMVTFGTHQGPIEPPTETPRPAPRSLDAREPAPVSEEPEDVPNPHVYRAPVPHQYRNRIYSQRPPADLALGTPVDQKYTPSIEKADVYRKQSRSEGVGYTGPHVFERQEYEVIEAQKAKDRADVRYIKPQYYEQKLQRQEKRVPQIGIIYSSGVRYYIPQLVYAEPRRDEEQENSVYDSKDEKYLYRKEQ